MIVNFFCKNWTIYNIINAIKKSSDSKYRDFKSVSADWDKYGILMNDGTVDLMGKWDDRFEKNYNIQTLEKYSGKIINKLENIQTLSLHRYGGIAITYDGNVIVWGFQIPAGDKYYELSLNM